MKRQMMFVLVMSIASAFSVRAQDLVPSSIATEVRKSFPDSLKGGVGAILMTSRGYLLAGKADAFFVGSLWRSSDCGNSWTKMEGWKSWPEIYSFIETELGHILAGNVDGIYRSTDNGETWTRIHVANPAPWVRSLAKSDSFIFANGPAPYPVYRSSDEGLTWEPVGQGLLDSSGVRTLRVSEEGWLYLGSGGIMPTPPRERGQGVFRSKDNGMTWDTINNGLPVLEGYIPIWPVATASNGCMFAGVRGGGIFCSTNRGDHWSESNSNLTERYPTALLATEEGYVFAGFENRFPHRGGVYLSLDHGNFWHYLGLEKTGIIWSLTFVPDSSYLFVGTHSDGVWRIKLNIITKVEEVDNVPSSFTLHQNYPNPFNPSTTIEFTLPERAFVTVTVVNLLGQEVATLVAEEVSAGTHKTTWSASGLPSGIYFARLEANNFTATKKMVLMK